MKKRKNIKAMVKKTRKAGKPTSIKKLETNREAIFANFIESVDTGQKELDRERNKMLKKLENRLTARFRRKENDLEKTKEEMVSQKTEAEKRIGELNNKLNEKSRIINDLQQKLNSILKDLKA